MKFTQYGGVEVLLSIEPRKEGGLLNCDDCGQLVTIVKDTGPGIRKEIREKLFRIFGLASDSDTGVVTNKGIGLGLGICKSLVEKLGGTILVETQEGFGTEVLFMIPFKC